MPRMFAATGRPVTRLYPLTLLFAVDGSMFASWVVRVPAVKEQVGASATTLGFALLAMTCCLTVSMLAGGGLCERFGTRRMMVAIFPLMAVVLVLPGLARTTVELGAALGLYGATYGCLAVALNAAAVEVETATGRAIMSPLHGLWSLGGLAGSVVGGLVAERLSTVAHLGLAAGAGLVVTAVAGPRLLAGDASERRAGGARTAPAPATTPEQTAPNKTLGTAVVLFGVVALCTAYSEGAVGDWTTLHLRDDLGTTASAAAYGFGVYSVAIAAARLAGGRLIMRIGETAVLTGGALVSGLGILVTAWTSHLAVAFAGLLLVGLGLANMFPIAMARAGAVGGARGVSLASTIGTTGMVAGPPIIGFIAGQLGLPTAMSTIAVLSAVAAVLGIVLRTRVPSPRGRTSLERAAEGEPTPAG